MNSIPENIYATLNSTIQWAKDRNIIGGSKPKDQLAKLIQELGEVSEAICKDDVDGLKKEIGDMLVVLTILSEMYGLSIPECMGAAYKKIENRRGVMFDGVFIKETDEDFQEVLKRI